MNPPPIHLAETPSTNDWLRTHAATLADGQWVSADRQTKGRGRMARAWEAPEGNLAASLWAVPREGEGAAAELSFVAALALHDVCATHVKPGRLMLKWPNDLLLDGAKLSGILLEREGNGVIVGIGVNLAAAPEVAGRKTIALADVAPAPKPAAFLEALAAAFEARRIAWAREGFAAIREAWLARAHPVGAPLKLTSPGKGGDALEGRFAGLGADGALHLELAPGQVHVVHAGDVMLGGEGRERADAAGD